MSTSINVFEPMFAVVLLPSDANPNVVGLVLVHTLVYRVSPALMLMLSWVHTSMLLSVLLTIKLMVLSELVELEIARSLSLKAATSWPPITVVLRFVQSVGRLTTLWSLPLTIRSSGDPVDPKNSSLICILAVMIVSGVMFPSLSLVWRM